MLHFNIKENAVVSAIPFLTMWFFSMALSKGLDALRARGTISTTFARKLSTLIASAVPMVCLFLLCYIGCHRSLAVLIMGIGQLIYRLQNSKIFFSILKMSIFRYYVHRWYVLWFSIKSHRYCTQLCRNSNGHYKYSRHFAWYHNANICWCHHTWQCK